MAIVIPTKLVEENKDFGRTINQLMEIFISKEMEKRGVKEFHAAIVEIFDDGKPPKVYLNEEATFILTFKDKKLNLNSIGPMTIDLKEIENIEWHNEVLDKNSAKFFIIHWGKDYWILDFDFRYNKGTAKIKLERAEEFLDAAKKLNFPNNLNPLIYLLWSVYELIVDAKLYLLPQQKPKPKHGDRKEKLEKFSNTSNIFSKEFVSIFNELSEEKNNARYGGAVKNQFNNDVLKIAEREIQNINI